MTRTLPRAVLLLLALGLGALLPDVARAQCAMCQTALTGSPEGRALASHFNRAILLMLVAPYLIFGSVLMAAFRRRIARTFARTFARILARTRTRDRTRARLAGPFHAPTG